MLIPYDLLAVSTLRALIEEFVSRDGTDYGITEATLEHKVQQVLSQLQRGQVLISYDPASESCTIVPKDCI